MISIFLIFLVIIMVRKKIIEICIVNISANPHPKDIYFDLFKKAGNKKVKYTVNGEKTAFFSNPKKIENYEDFFYGHLFTYIEINREREWGDIKKEQILNMEEKEEKLKSIDEIGENYCLSPNSFNYVFKIDDHKLFIERKNSMNKRITPGQIKNILIKLMGPEIQGKDVPNVEITIIPENNVVDDILSISELNKLNIRILKPNPDNTTDKSYNQVIKNLEEHNARQIEYKWIKDRKKDSLNLDDEIRYLAKFAAENGCVSGEGININNKKISISTESKPEVLKVEDDPNETLFDKLDKIFNFRGKK